MLRSRTAWPAILAAALCFACVTALAEPVPGRQGNGTSEPDSYVSTAPPEVGIAPGTIENSAVGGGTNGNLAVVNALLSGVGLYIGTEWYGWSDTQRKAAITNAANWGFAFLSPKIASEGGSTWYSSTTQLDNWVTWCTQAGIKFFPFSYVDPSTGGTGTTIATNRGAAIASEIAHHCGLVLVDMEAEWQSTTDAYGPNMTAFGTAYRSGAPDLPIVVTGFGDPTSVQGSGWPYAEMKSFADAYAPQWYYPWWSWYRNTKGVAGVKNVIDTCYNQCKTYFGSTYPMLPNGAWENDPSDSVTPAALPDLYAGTAYMRKFNAPIIWWEYSYMTRAIGSALVGYGYFTDQAVPTGSPARPASIVASATSVPGGSNVTFTINICGPAPVGGQSIGLASTDTSALPLPATVTVPRGSSWVDVVVTTGFVTSSRSATITASNSATGTTMTTAKTITVTQSGYPVTALNVNPATVPSGDSSTGTITISGAALAGGEVVNVSSNSTNVIVPTGGVTVLSGQTTATFPITTKVNLGSPVNATLTASWGASSVQTPFTVTPVGVSSVSVSPPNVIAGRPSVGTVTLLGPAPSTGLLVSLGSNNANVSVPAEGVTVAPGASTATFDITTSPAITTTSFVTITAGYNGTSVQTTLTVNPVVVNTLSLNPDTIRGGNSSTGTITLTAEAPVGGVDVSVVSDSPDVAKVVTPVNVPEGQKTAMFTITGIDGPTTSYANITAWLNGGASTQAVTVRPRHDVNGDDVFDVNDVPAALAIVAGLSGIEGDQIVAVDVDGSGTADISDVVALLRLALAQ